LVSLRGLEFSIPICLGQLQRDTLTAVFVVIFKETKTWRPDQIIKRVFHKTAEKREPFKDFLYLLLDSFKKKTDNYISRR
jgi:hypothetical protein